MELSIAEARDLGIRVLEAAGATSANAGHVMDGILAAETAGVTSHGLTWVPLFADHLANGKVDGKAEPEVTLVAPAGLLVDARAGFAQAAMAAGIGRLVPLAHDTGIAAMAVTNSSNCLLVGHYVERLAAAGLIGFTFVNAPKSMAPWGGSKPVFGTNPMAFACPRRAGPPVVLDFATSKVARSEIRLAMQEGRDIPLGWALDPDGHPTTDPAAAMAGSVLPFGEHKGYGLALMIDLMAGALCNAHFSHEAPAFLGEDSRPSGTGQFIIAIAPAVFGGAHFIDRVERLFSVIREQPDVELPGDRRLAARARQTGRPLAVPRALYDELVRRSEMKPG